MENHTQLKIISEIHLYAFMCANPSEQSFIIPQDLGKSNFQLLHQHASVAIDNGNIASKCNCKWANEFDKFMTIKPAILLMNEYCTKEWTSTQKGKNK